jgi:hypothetical protein
MNIIKCLLLSALILPALEGCHVPLRPYRLDRPAIELPVVPPNSPITPIAFAGQQNECVTAATPICLAFIEVDDMGELFDEKEVKAALEVIQRANEHAKSLPPEAAPVVVTFIHGWKNNAAPDNDNVKGFISALQQLYQHNSARPVIGVYIGWRGDLIRSYFPVARQLSYYNREAAAIRVPGATLATALAMIASTTHENKHGLVVFIGHSFGGLVLERSVSESTASQIAQESINPQNAEGAADAPAQTAPSSRADLVIFINPAGAATEAKQMLDFLAYNGYRYQPGQSSNPGAPSEAASDTTADRPLIVSLSSTADLATKVALPIGHSLPYLGFKNAGSFRDLGEKDGGKYALQCFDPHVAGRNPYWTLDTKAEGAQPQGSYYLSSTPHMQVLQSHVMLKAVGASQMKVSSTGELITIKDPKAIADCDRNLFNQQGLNVVSTFRLHDTQTCFAVQERPNRCNGTPYWVMEIDPDVVPDHSTIFTQRFIWFLINTFFSSEGQPMVRVKPQLIKTQH